MRKVVDDAGDGSATFLNVKVQLKSSPEKNAVSEKEGKTLMFEGKSLIAVQSAVPLRVLTALDLELAFALNILKADLQGCK